MLKQFGTVEELIASHKQCEKKESCNCFSKTPKLICSDAWTCCLIKHYEEKLKEQEQRTEDKGE